MSNTLAWLFVSAALSAVGYTARWLPPKKKAKSKRPVRRKKK